MALPAPVEQPGVKYPQRERVQLGTIGVSLAAQPHAWPLPIAASLLEPYQQHELQVPDLDVVAASKMLESHCTPNLQHSRVYAPFAVSQATLPPAILEHLQTSRFGYLNAINTIWVSGKRTYFWNLTTGETREFEVPTSGPDKPAQIIDIACVAPSPQVFSDSVKHLLVVSTADTMQLYAVDKQSAVFDTDLQIPITGLGAPKVAGASGGRIFFACAKTGSSIWEFKYAEKETWFKSKVQRVCHGEYGGLFGGLLGKRANDDPNAERVLDLQVDESVEHVYVLTSRSEIHIYTFDPQGTHFSLANSFNLGQIRSALSLIGNTHSVARLVSLSKVPVSASKFIRLVAVTSTGSRVYFRSRDSAKRARIQCAYIQELGKGFDVNMAKVGSGRVTITSAKKTTTTSESGSAATTTTTTTSTNNVLASIIDQARVNHVFDMNQAIPFVELSGWVPLDGPPLLFVTSEEKANKLGQPETDLVLTGTSLYTLRRRPFSERLEYQDVLVALTHIYGTTQLCYGALEAATQTTNAIARDNAIQNLFRFGGLPMFLREESLFLGHASIRLSPLLDGFALYLARILLPVWTKKILGADGLGRGVDDNMLQFVYSQLSGLVQFLDRNRSFSEGMSERHPIATSSALSGGNDNATLLSQAENKAVQALGRLARSSQEGIAFLRVVLAENHDTKQLLSYFDKSLMAKFKELTFGEFFTEAKNSNVARELVNSLINYVLNRGESVETVASVIQDRCGSYCSPGDVLEYKALEYIHHVKKNKKKNQIDTASLAKSVNLIRKAAASIQLGTLRDIVDDYVSLSYYQGAVQACLAVAAEQDPANIAVGFLRHHKDLGVHENSAKRRLIEAIPHSEAGVAVDHLSVGFSQQQQQSQQVEFQSDSEIKYMAKMAVFNLIFTELLDKFPGLTDVNSSDPAHAAMLNSTDEVWHFALYDWYLSHGKQDQIALLDTPYVANYLQQGASADLRVANLLWKWHQHHGDLLAAADVLLDLARGPLVPTLSQRVEYLSRAMGYCRAQPLQTQQAVRMMTMVRSYLGIALLQTDILTKLQSRTKTADHSELETKLFTVSDLFNDWAEPNGLYDVCFAIFEFSDFRDPVEIQQCWANLLTKTRIEDTREKSSSHYAHVSALITQLGAKYKAVPTIFSLPNLVPMLEQYAVDYARDSPRGWIVDAFTNAGISDAILKEVYTDILDNKVLEGEYAAHARASLEYINRNM